MGDFSTWYNTIPRFTRYWLTATVILSLLPKIGFISGYYFFLSYELLIKKLQLWRAVTAVCCYPMSFQWLINCFFIYQYSSALEKDQFKQSPADYFFLLMFSWSFAVICGLIFKLFFLMDVMILAVLYIWCQLNKEVIVNFWFGAKFKAMYLPWVLLVVNFILSKGEFDSLIGIMIGHLYYFLKYQYPQDHGGKQLLNTPQFLKTYFPDAVGGVHGFFGVPPANQRQAPPARNRLFADTWGAGNTLGRS